MTLAPVVIAMGSSLGNRTHLLRAGVRELGSFIRVVRISSVWETEPMDSPPGAPSFLNLVVAGLTRNRPRQLLDQLHEIELELGRSRRHRNEPRVIDLDLILYDCRRMRRDRFEIPHPRYRDRAFVLEPLKELGLDWVDPSTGHRIRDLHGVGEVVRIGRLFGD